MTSYFVTGATGPVGHALCRELVARGHTVVGLSRTQAGAHTVATTGASPVVGSLRDVGALSEGVAQAERVLHAASSVRGMGRDTPDRVNREGMEALVEALRQRGSQVRHLTVLSCASVYGDRSGLWVDESMPPAPHTRYGTSKLAAEEIARRAANEALEVRIARLGWIYGPGHPFLHAEEIRQGRARLPGEGRNVLPVVAVDDAVRGVLLVDEKAHPGEIVHVSDRTSADLRTFYDHVHRSVGGEPMRFWSTWVPSWVQVPAARMNERLMSRTGRLPRFTPDFLKLYTANVRLKVDRLEELGMVWDSPDPAAGLARIFGERHAGAA